MTDPRVVVGIDLGGAEIASGAVTSTGEISATRNVPTPAAAGGPGPILDAVAGLITETASAARAAGRIVTVVAVATAGTVDRQPEWTETNLGEQLGAKTGLRARVWNAGHAAAWGEWRMGAGRGTSHMIMVTLGTAIGGGVIVDGALVLGSHGAAARIGHVSVDPDGRPCWCGGSGCVEGYASSAAIAREARAALDRGANTALRALGALPTAADVLTAAETGDACATAIVAEAGRRLGIAFVALVNLFDPQRIVVGGGVADEGNLLLAPTRELLARRLPAPLATSVSVTRGALGPHAAIVGAALLAWDRLPAA